MNKKNLNRWANSLLKKDREGRKLIKTQVASSFHSSNAFAPGLRNIRNHIKKIKKTK